MDAILSFLDRLKQAWAVRRRVKAAEDVAVGEALAEQAADNDQAVAKAASAFEAQKRERDPAAPVAPMPLAVTLPLPGPVRS